MAEMIQLRVKVFVTDGVPLKSVKAHLRAIVRDAGRQLTGTIPADNADLLDHPTIYWDAAEIYQGAETVARKRKATDAVS